MVGLWYTLISGWIIAAVSAVASFLWYSAEPGPEARAAFWIAVSVLVVATIGIPMEYFFSEELRRRRAERKEKQRKDLDWLVDGIDGELKNFQHIAAGKPYSGEAHRRAVEDVSVEMLGEEVKNFRNSWRFGRRAKKVLAELEHVRSQPRNQKDLSRLLPAVYSLRAKAYPRLIKLGGPAQL